MRSRSRTGLILFGGILSGLILQAACKDTPSAPGAPIVADGTLHQVRWNSSEPRGFRSGKTGVLMAPGAMPTAPAAGTASFWAYTNRDVTYTAFVEAPDGSWQPYVTFFVPRGSLLARPNGAPFLSQDSILITLSLDPEAMDISFAPDGLRFNPLVPARLTISYDLASPDLNGDGAVNAVDEYIQQVLLSVSIRQSEQDPWTVMPSVNDVLQRTLSADVQHFTGYAVSW